MTLAVAFVGQASPRGGKQRARPSMPPAPLSATADRRTQLKGPAAQERRVRSRRLFRDLSSAEALAAARHSFGSLLTSPVQRPSLATKLKGYANDHVGVLGNGAVVQSLAPLRARTNDGSKRPVDLRLRHRAGYSEPMASPAPVRLADRAGQGMRLARSGVGLKPIVAHGGARGREVAGRLFYPNVDADTDLLVQPQDSGAEAFTQLRSPASPRSLTYALSLPAGAVAREARGGLAVEVSRGGKRIAAIGAPVAWDADGAPVATSYRLEGRRLTVGVDHRSGRHAYPIVVDPSMTELMDFRSPDPNIAIATGWVFFNYGHNVFKWNINGVEGPGLYVYITGGTTFYGPGGPQIFGDYGTWVWTAPTDTNIWKVESWASTRQGFDYLSIGRGIWNQTQANWGPGQPHKQTFVNYTDQLDVSCNDVSCVNENAGDTGNDFWMFFQANKNGTVAPGVTLYAYLSKANIYLHDGFPPAVTNVDASETSGQWREGNAGPFQVYASDRGLGISKLTVKDPTGGVNLTQNAPCTGQRTSRCPKTVPESGGWSPTFSYNTANLPEGLNTLTATAYDVAQNTGTRQWQVKVDRTGPAVTSSGALWDLREQTLAPGTYNLHVAADDGATNATAANARSGLARIDVLVDGEVEQTYLQPTCSATGCGGATDYVFDTDEWPAEQHTIDIVATDNMGHPTTRSFNVTVPGEAGAAPTQETDVLTPAEAIPDTPTPPEVRSPLVPNPAVADAEHTAAETDVLVDDPLDPVTESSSATDFSPAVSPSRTVITGNPNSRGLTSDGSTPSDSNGAASPQRYIEIVNRQVRLHDRNLLPLATSSLAAFVGSPNADVFDPQIMWDGQSQRWYYLADRITAGGDYYLAFGWSRTANPLTLGAGDWCQWFRRTNFFEDYPKLGDSQRHLVFGTDIFEYAGAGAPFLSARIYGVPKPLAGTNCVRPNIFWWRGPNDVMVTRDNTTVFAPVPAHTYATGAVGFVAAADFPGSDQPEQTANQVQTWHVSGQRNRPRLTPDANVSVAQYRIPPLIRQPGSTRRIDSRETEFGQAVAMRDPAASNQLALWVQHTIRAPSGRARVRWYELLPRVTPARRQQGNVSDPAHSAFNGAISPNANGGAVIQYNVGSAALRPQVRARSRLSGTDLNRMTGEVTVANSDNFAEEDRYCDQVRLGRTLASCRWGDYASAVPDPSLASDVWGTNMLIGTPGLDPSDPHWTTQNFRVTATP